MAKKILNGALMGFLATIVVWVFAKYIASDLMYSYEAKTYDWRVGKKILELDLAARMGVDIIAIRRNKDWILDPIETEQIFLGDILITRGAPLGIKEFKQLAEAKLKQLEY